MSTLQRRSAYPTPGEKKTKQIRQQQQQQQKKPDEKNVERNNTQHITKSLHKGYGTWWREMRVCYIWRTTNKTNKE